MSSWGCQGKEMVPDTVDHVVVPVDPKEDRSWLQSAPKVPTDKAHAHDRVGPNMDTPENWSEAVKRLKPRVLQRLIDTHKCARPPVHCSVALGPEHHHKGVAHRSDMLTLDSSIMFT